MNFVTLSVIHDGLPSSMRRGPWCSDVCLLLPRANHWFFRNRIHLHEVVAHRNEEPSWLNRTSLPADVMIGLSLSITQNGSQSRNDTCHVSCFSLFLCVCVSWSWSHSSLKSCHSFSIAFSVWYSVFYFLNTNQFHCVIIIGIYAFCFLLCVMSSVLQSVESDLTTLRPRLLKTYLFHP